MRLFHGTIADNLPSILARGLLTEKGSENWTVSGEAVYFWSPEALIKNGETEEEYAEDKAKELAFESAQCALGFAKDCRAIIIEVELDESTDVAPDESCPNMSTSGAVCTFENVPFSAIKSIRVSPDLSLLKGYFLSLMLDREMNARSFSYIEQAVAEAMKKAEFCPEMEDISGSWEEWETVYLDSHEILNTI